VYREIVELDKKVQVALSGRKIAARRRTEQIEAADVVLSA
jgi:hypothetical protein